MARLKCLGHTEYTTKTCRVQQLGSGSNNSISFVHRDGVEFNDNIAIFSHELIFIVIAETV